MVSASMIHHMNVPIDDIDTARDFYGRVLGLAEIKRPGLWYGCGGNELHLSVQPGLRGGPHRDEPAADRSPRPDRTGGHVAFTMSGSLDDDARCLEAERIPYARGRSGLPQMFCENPARNLIELPQLRISDAMCRNHASVVFHSECQRSRSAAAREHSEPGPLEREVRRPRVLPGAHWRSWSAQ